MRIPAILNGNSDDVERDWKRVAWWSNFSVGVQHRVDMIGFLSELRAALSILKGDALLRGRQKALQAICRGSQVVW
jgi:hypothetical protein